MAEHGDSIDFDTVGFDDFPAHEASYHSFLTIAKYGTIAVIVLLVLMAIFVV